MITKTQSETYRIQRKHFFFLILKALLREKLTAIQSYLRKQEKSQKTP